MKRIVLAATVLAVLGLVGGTALAAPATTPGKGRPHPGGWFIRLAERAGLNVADEQKAKIREVCKERWQQVKAVLTPEQLKVLQDARGQGRVAVREAIKQVRASLSAEQKTKIREIRQAARQSIRDILSPEQRAKLREWFKEHHTAKATAPAKS